MGTRSYTWAGDSARRDKSRLYYTVGWGAVALLAVGQDAWFAFLKDTSFYWSESILYKIYWLLFIPQTSLVAHLAKKWPVIHFRQNALKHVAVAFSSSLAQVLIFSGLMTVLSGLLLGYTFRFEGVLRKSLSEDLFVGILTYGLLLLVFNRFSEKDKKVEVKRTSPIKATTPEYLTTFLVKEGTRTIRLTTDTIDWIGSEDSYTVLHGVEGKWLYSESLSKLEKQLNPEDFVRIHRSSIVNIRQVQKVTSRRTGDYDVQLADGTLMRLSRHYAGKVKGRLI